MMLKDSFAEKGAFETLRKVSSIGYHAVEISQIPMTAENVADLDRARNELGMDIAALSVTLEAPKGYPGTRSTATSTRSLTTACVSAPGSCALACFPSRR
jgi:sugar phosphate isomerase/epimerase